MPDGTETELKLVASPAMLQHLRDEPLLAGEEHVQTLVTRYFDTAEGTLHGAGASLRVRDGNGHSEQTFKSRAAGDGLQRGEWNAPAAGELPDPGAFPPVARQSLEALLDGSPLQPLAVTRIERTSRRLRQGTSAIEAAFDRGTVEADGRGIEVCELELELADGDAADLFALARELPLGPELGWSIESKGERGHALALDLPFAAVRASPVALSPEMDVGQGFRAIAWNCLRQLLGNYREVIASGDPDAVHQSRVAMRRLRAAMSIFGARIADAQTPMFRAEWKAAAAALGPARDLHVLTERVEAAAQASGADAEDLVHRLRGKRAAATREAQAALAGTAFQHLLVGFAAWLESEMPQAPEPLADFAAQALGRRRRKLVKHRKLPAMSEEALHAIRIRGKKLRYAAEFFAALYPQESRASRRSFAKALGTMQDCLGSVHDLAVARAQRENLFADLDPISAARLSAQLADLLDDHGPSRKQLIRSAAKALDRVADAPAWWRCADVSEAAPEAGDD